MERWTLDYLDQVCGDEMVHVMAGRDSDPLYEQHSGNHRTTMRFGDFVAKVRDAGQTNDFYMVANNDFMRTASVKRLYDDMVVFPDYLDDRRDGSASSRESMRTSGVFMRPRLDRSRSNCRWRGRDTISRTEAGACRRAPGFGPATAGVRRASSIASAGVWQSAC
jgi:hypothetical protein